MGGGGAGLEQARQRERGELARRPLAAAVRACCRACPLQLFTPTLSPQGRHPWHLRLTKPNRRLHPGPLRLQNGKTSVKCPKIQRLVTPQVLQRKRRRAALKKERITRKKAEASEYHKLLVTRLKEQRERRSESLAKKRAIRMASVASKEA